MRIWGRALLLSVSAVLLNLGLVLAIIPDHPATAVVYTLALTACVAGIFLPEIGPLRRAKPRHVIGILGVGLLSQLILLVRLPPGYVLQPPFPAAGAPFAVGLALLTVLVIVILLRPVRSAFEPSFMLLLAIFFAMGTWMIAISPDPPMDVHIFQEQGAEALLRGENPYSIRTYPDLYGPESGLYAPELVDDGHLTFGFTYPPLSMLLALPAHVLGGDYRYAQLASMVIAAVLMVSIRPGKVAMLAALLVLLNPRAFFILEAGWTDPYVLMLLAGTVLLAVRQSPLLPVGLGVLIAIKQHMVIALPLAVVALDGALSGRGRLRTAAVGVLVASAVSLPMILWNVPDFVHSTIAVHVVQPFRADSMSYLAWLGQDGRPGLPTWTGFALLVPTAAVALWRLGRSPAAFAVTLAFVYFVFFLFSKQAFIHYYYFVAGALCVAIAAVASAERAPSRMRAIGQ